MTPLPRLSNSERRRRERDLRRMVWVLLLIVAYSIGKAAGYSEFEQLLKRWAP